MSFQDKITSLMSRPGQDAVEKDDIPWWMKFIGRGVGTIGGFIAVILGVWMCVSISFTNIVGGLWQITAGFILISCEAPCCCMFVDHVQKLADKVDSRPIWNRAVAYVVLALPPIILAFGLSSLFGSGLIFTTGVIYAMMALGKKATMDEMRQAAVLEDKPKSGMHSNLVSNAQPVSFTGPPIFASKV